METVKSGIEILSAGVSCSAIVLYDLSMLPERVRQKFCKEFENAIQEDRRLKQVTVGYRKRTVFFKNVHIGALAFHCYLF